MNRKLVFAFTFLFALVVFLAHYAVVGSGVWGDGRYYYSQLRSAVIDGDLDFRNEFEYFSCPLAVTETGMIANKYSLGPALLWSPFFLLAHVTTTFFSLWNYLPPDGFSLLYQTFVGIGAVFYGLLGLWLSFRVIEEYFSLGIALIATLTLWLASNLFFYTAVDPINSHPVSFFTAAAVIFVWRRYSQKRTNFHLVILGLLVGLLAMIRTQDLIFTFPILIWLLKDWRKGIRLAFNKVSIFLFFVLGGFFPQLLVWRFLYGEFNSPYLIGGEGFDWLRPQILSVWFSANNGLFFYSPILLLAIIGFFYFSKKSPLLAMSGTFLFFLQTYLVASWHTWEGGAAYGGRMFISLMPFFIMGLAAFLARYRSRFIYLALLALIVLNFSLMIKFLLLN